MTHAFFKALLFLSAGSVILALHHEQDIFRMGGLRKKLPIPFFTMVIGSVALAGLPLTSGFYSKDAILLASADSPVGGIWFWAIAGMAAFLTALYTSRMIYLTFFGEMKTEPHGGPTPVMSVPLVLLAVLSVAGGWFGLDVVAAVLPDGGLDPDHSGPLVWLTALIPIAGLVAGYLLYGSHTLNFDALTRSAAGQRLQRFWASGWGFDSLYDALIVNPFCRLAALNKADFVDLVYTLIAAITRRSHQLVVQSQTGRLRWYAANMSIGLVVVLIAVLVLS